ncbi:hypothetical protein [Thermus islandicus]|nr:hypothetical protein [Thermus islandicus]
MSRSYRLFLRDMWEASKKILRYTRGLDFGGFVQAEGLRQILEEEDA